MKAMIMVAGAMLAMGLSAPAMAQSAGTKYGTREPTKCPSVTTPKNGPPSAAAIKQLVMCNSERDLGQSIYLMDNVQVQVGASRRYVAADALLTTDADTKAPEYPIRGSFTEVSCIRQFAWSSFKGKNCTTTHITEDHGVCWRTTFGDWRCGFGGRDLRQEEPVRDQAPPPDVAAP